MFPVQPAAYSPSQGSITWVDFPLIRDANVRYQFWNRTAHFLSRLRDFAAAACVLHVLTQVVTVIKPYGEVVQRACIKGGGGEERGSGKIREVKEK